MALEVHMTTNSLDLNSLRPPSDGTTKFLSWAREQILKYNNFIITDHCNKRITENGRMSWQQIREVIENGGFRNGSPHPRYFTGKIEWKEYVVVIGSDAKTSDSDNKPTLITCYLKSEADEEAFLLERIQEPQVIEREVVKTVEVVKAVEDLSIEKLEEILGKKRASEKDAIHAVQRSIIKESSEAITTIEYRIVALLKEKDAWVKKKTNAEMVLGETVTATPVAVAPVKTERSSRNDFPDHESMTKLWEINFHRFVFAKSHRLNVSAMAADLNVRKRDLRQWVKTHHPARVS
jgi:hypothetical protein